MPRRRLPPGRRRARSGRRGCRPRAGRSREVHRARWRSTEASSVTSGRVASRNAASTTRSKPRSKTTVAIRGRTRTRRGRPSGRGAGRRRAQEDVVHRDAGDDHLDELALARARRGDPAPAGCLEPVDDADAHDGEHERASPDCLSVCQTVPRSAPRTARSRNATDAGMPMIAASHIVRRFRSGIPDTRGVCTVRGTATRGRRSPSEACAQRRTDTIGGGRDRPSPTSRQVLRRNGDHSPMAASSDLADVRAPGFDQASPTVLAPSRDPGDEPVPGLPRRARRRRPADGVRAVARRGRHMADADGGPRDRRPRASGCGAR